MHIVVETLITTGLMLYYLLEGLVLLFVPFSLRRKDVKGQRVLITGAGSGLGRLMSQKFAKLGCTVVLVDIDKAGMEESRNLIREYGTSVHAYVCDLSQRDDVYRVLEKVKTEVGDIDILINNAGIVSGHKILQCPDALMQKTMDVNANAHFWTVKSLLPAMLKRNHGHVVTVASAAGITGVNGLVDYCASKFAAVGFDESLRAELDSLGKHGVRTTVVCPFYISTGMFDGVTTRFPWMLPILDPEYVVDRIMDGVLCNQAIVCIPRIVYVFAYMKTIVPTKAFLLVSNFVGLNQSMAEFKGRQKRD
jgi:all-trans-retinol dehydrogenase (NAD+)